MARGWLFLLALWVLFFFGISRYKHYTKQDALAVGRLAIFATIATIAVLLVGALVIIAFD